MQEKVKYLNTSDLHQLKGGIGNSSPAPPFSEPPLPNCNLDGTDRGGQDPAPTPDDPPPIW